MKSRPQCHHPLSNEGEECPDGHKALENGDQARQELYSVYEAPNEIAARSVAAILEGQGIEAMIKSEQISMYDGLAMMIRPVWGRVLVLEGDLARASQIVKDYLASLDSEDKDGGQGN